MISNAVENPTMRKMIITLLALALLSGLAFAEPITTDVNEKEFDAVLHLDTASDIHLLKDLYLTLTARDGADYRLLASGAEVAYLRDLGYNVEVLRRKETPSTKAYRDYATSMTELQTIASTYPALTHLSEVADSANGKKVMVLKISDNAADDEAEPVVLYDAAIHGDEAIGNELSFAFIYYLLQNYGSDARITTLVDENEIYVVPFMNPDGLTLRRGNGNGVDMNRNYPFSWEGFGSYTPESETVGVMKLGLEIRPVLTVSYHGGAEVINYTWDGFYTLSPDNDLEVYMSNVYAAQSNYDITNGAAWYIADGTTEDWYHGTLGSLSIILEISTVKMPGASAMQAYINKNIPSMIDWAEQTDNGVRGIVSDSVSGEPLEALVLTGGRLPVTSDPLVGDYYRLLAPGAQTLNVWANGYGWNQVNVTVPSSGYTEEDIDLDPAKDAVYAALRTVFMVRKDASDNPPNVTLPTAALGGHDGNAFSTGVNGYVVFDMGEFTPIVDGVGEELTVYENGDDEGYSVLVSQDWTGSWQTVGTGSGTTSFDIGVSGLSEARYVMIRDDGDGNNNEATPGVDIDAIEATPVCDAPAADFSAEPRTGSAPLAVDFTNLTVADAGCLSSVQWSFGDGGTSNEANPAHTYTQAGSYTVTLTATGPGGDDQMVREDYITVSGGGDDDDDDTIDDDDAADDDAAVDDDDDDDDDDDGCGC